MWKRLFLCLLVSSSVTYADVYWTEEQQVEMEQLVQEADQVIQQQAEDLKLLSRQLQESQKETRELEIRYKRCKTCLKVSVGITAASLALTYLVIRNK